MTDPSLVVAPAAPTETAVDAVLDRLVFLARFFGRGVDAAQIIAGIPLPEGRVTRQELAECAGRAGLSLTSCKADPAQLRASALPVLAMTSAGEALVILKRDGERLECAQTGIEGLTWLPLATVAEEYAGDWYYVRPVFYFDARSLLYQKTHPRRWFWDVFLENRAIYGWALLATAMVNLFGAVIPFFTMAVYDRVVPNNALDSLWVLTTAVVVVTVFDLFIKMLRSYLLEAAGRRADIAMSSHIFAHTLKLRAASRPASGGVLANVVRDFESVREFFTSTTLTLLGDMPFMFFYIGVIALVGGWLALVPLVMVPIILISALLLRRPIGKILNENMKETAQRTAHLFETMNGLDTVKSLGADAWSRRKWEMLTIKISENSVRMREWSTFGTNLSATLTGLTTVLLIVFGALMIAEGQLTMGQLIAVSMLAARAMAPAGQIAGLIIRYEQTKLALSALDKVMASPVDEQVDSLHIANLRGQIEFRDVHFAYPDSPPLLKGLNLKIAPGEKVGFIGRIGSGKSTLLRMLVNLYGPDQGTVLIDGLSIGQIEPLSLRRRIGYVPQDVVLFHGDIRENILLGTTDVSDEQLLGAVRFACLEETLAQMPNGLGTQVGERGERVSGGQRQAVCIARAVAHLPNVLLLDEPTSMMDPATEQMLIQNLRRLQNVTLLLVTHRTAMLPLVDRLVVMDQGRVVLDGPRDVVLKQLQSGQARDAKAVMEQTA
ncbi:MAG: type I secretion system permease/ATPase [Gammaproteobacteria bacterium]|nr:type I secretion system permease/ATPase [Gammaproteobacteria bacterium]